jgi:hypothetical protein
MRRGLILALVALTAVALPCHAQAQSRAQQLSAQARAQIDDINPDSARTLLIDALRLSVTQNERLRAFTLLAIAELNRKNATAARDAFVRALAIEPTLRIDSLESLDNEAPTVFAAARSIAGAPTVQVPVAAREERVVLLLTVIVPSDTTVAAADARLPITLIPNSQSRVVTSIALPSAPAVALWADTQSTSSRRRIDWPMRKADGSVWAEGSYVLRAHAVDTVGQMTTEERIVRIARVPVDTQAHPAPLAATAFAPESRPAATRTGPRLATGGALALLVAIAPSMLGSPDLNSGVSGDPTSFAVAGGVALGSVIGFVKGRKPQPLTANIAKNRTLRENDRQQRATIIAANAEARSKAPVRVTTMRAP